MRTLGLIGGMSWESTAVYYRLINDGVRARLGGLHSAPLLLYSFDFEEIERCQAEGRWEDATRLMVDAGRRLAAGGADILVICTNTMHRMAEEVEAATRLPLLHIADATAAAVLESGLGRVGLLGTAFTMEQTFYRGRLEERHGLEVLVPEADERALIHRVIYEELCQGIVTPESKGAFLAIVDGLRKRHAEGVILGCTEIGLLISQEDVDVPLFDSTVIHADAAVAVALAS